MSDLGAILSDMKKLIEAVKSLKPNRVAVYMTSVAGLLTAAAPIVADLDTTDIVGLASGLAAIVAVVDRFLKGWQAYEVREQLAAESGHEFDSRAVSQVR